VQSQAWRAPAPDTLDMNILALLLQMEPSGQVENITRTFGVDWSHLIAQIISFCIVCAIFYRFAYRPVLTMLDERRQQIAQGLANAEKIKAELAQTEARRQEILTQANAEAIRLIEEGRTAAARVQEQDTKKAMTAAQQIIARSHEAAAQDYVRMLAELKREVGRLVVRTTVAVTGKILTPEDQRRLAEETAKEVAG
jgi:F-type H+-transporting ATPase subunit b